MRETRPLQWGREHDEHARQAYQKTKGSSVILTHSGLVISTEHGWLACSPDEVRDRYGMVEYKCPYSVRDTSVNEACNKKDFMTSLKDGQVTLKRSHKYFYQVQGQMAVCQRSWCDFVIWTPSSITVERIPFDEKLWMEVLPQLEYFFDNAILPELASPHHPQGQNILEPVAIPDIQR